MTAPRARQPLRRQCLRPGGFTLLELVVALSMVAVLIVSLSASLHIAYKAASGDEAAVEPDRTAHLAMEILRNDLENGLQSSGFLAGSFEGTQNQLGDGEADDLIFFSTADSPQHVDANGEIKQIELTLEQTPSGDRVLVRRVTRNLLAQTLTNPPTPDEEVLCRGVKSFSLEYLNGTTWTPTWDSTAEDGTIPTAVQVTLQLDRPGPRGQTQTLQFVRVFPLPCSTSATQTGANENL